ncbi:hypothetical protein [Alistipes putredinis]|uniref:hypothetical protein n=1 Tax=Alistipes putredinis TaxID=28117 RepID=UPI003AB77848
MDIIRITTTKTAQERTDRAFYNLDFTITDSALERVVATVYTPESRPDSDTPPTFIGTITYENGQIFCSLTKEASVAGMMADFESFMVQIQAAVAAETANE